MHKVEVGQIRKWKDPFQVRLKILAIEEKINKSGQSATMVIYKNLDNGLDESLALLPRIESDTIVDPDWLIEQEVKEWLNGQKT